jgi:hypothetical protein
MIFHCEGREEQEHFGSEGKVYGITPFSHSDSDCPDTDGACLENLLSLIDNGETVPVSNGKDRE